MGENDKNYQLSDDDLENVSGGENTDIDEQINMMNNFSGHASWAESEAETAEKEAREMEAKEYVRRTCPKCGMTFYSAPGNTNAAYVQNYESICPICRSIPII